jgi:hypothetical protein
MKSLLHHTHCKTGTLLTVLVLLVTLPAVAYVILSEEYFFEVPYQGESELHADLDLALGTVQLGKADEGFLFQAEILLENDKLQPDFQYEVEGTRGQLRVDLVTAKGERKAVRLPRFSSASSSRWSVLFGTEVPLDLKLDLGAARAEIDFTDLPIRRLNLGCGATSALVKFTAPNPEVMEVMQITAGASDFSAEGLGFARAKHIKFDGGIGKFRLDFSGPPGFARGARADLDIGVASVEIVLPKNTPTILHVSDTWLYSVTVPDEFTRNSNTGTWQSPGVQNEHQAFQIFIDAGFGKIQFINAP